MTKMFLKWNEKEKGYGCVWSGNWYRRRLPAQQELIFETKKTTLQFDQSRLDNGSHGWYLTGFEDVKLEGLVADLPFNPVHVKNII